MKISNEGMIIINDLTHPDYDPPNCPAWAKETIPASMVPYRGRNGLPDVYRTRNKAIGLPVEGIDRYHANQFIVYRPETARFLYEEYTPLEVNYPKGLLPSFEALAEEAAAGACSAAEKVIGFLRQVIFRVPHPAAPPCGTWVEADRNLDDEALLESGVGWCNEQARIFIRLCQVSGIPARIIQLFYSDNVSGHCLAEFYANGKWSMADPSWLCVFPDREGRLLSAAECHDSTEGRKANAKALRQRYEELQSASDEALRFRTAEEAAQWRTRFEERTESVLAAKLFCFGVINYPLPLR